MRMSGLAIGIILLVIVGLAVMVILPRPVTNAAPDEPETLPDVVTMAAPVAYCPPLVQTIPNGRVQVLVDSSSSMSGVRGPVVSSLRWIEQGLSRLRDSALIFDELRVAQFDAGRGIVAADGFPELAAAFAPAGQTSLHQAIRASPEYDLTLIITDGVAVAGTANGDCAGGVDAACVARALRDAVHLEQTTAIPPQPGIWLIPLWVRHSGIFSTEEPTASADFDGPASLQKLRGELGQDVSISNARSDAEGNLVFDYAGPRGLLLIVIARRDDLGRRVVSALRERMAENDVAAVTAVRDAIGPVSAFPPMELYPGHLPRLEWTDLQKAKTPMRGTLDAAFGDGRRIAIECAPGRRNEGEFHLTGRWPPRGGRCVDIYQLPAFELEFVAHDARDQASLSAFIAGSKHVTAGDREKFTIGLRCGEGEQRPCTSDPATVTWMAQSRYDYVRDVPDAERSGAAAILGAVATTDLLAQPHRIYGLESLVSIFFDEVRQDRRRAPLADLELCHGRLQQRAKEHADDQYLSETPR